jgi:hypothetical protein
MYTYGVGSLIDLPNMAVLVAGLDDWDLQHCEPVREDRLLAALRGQLGPQLDAMHSPPWVEETQNVFDDWTRVGIPVLPFPRWLRCPRCGLLSANVGDDGRAIFNLSTEPARPDRARFVHTGCTRAKSPTAVPARFVVACNDGHIDEFPWVLFTHLKTGGTCPGVPSLEIQDRGRGNRSTEVQVTCRTCNASSFVTQAFNNRDATMPTCRGREAHLRRFAAGGCSLQVKPLLLGASNAWFALTESALSIPRSSDPLLELLDKLRDQLVGVTEQGDIAQALKYNPSLAELKVFSVDAVWEGLQEMRGAVAGQPGAGDLRRPEWEVFQNPAAAPVGADFQIAAERVPSGYGALVGSIVRADRLREVVALTGFTRIDAPDSGVDEDAEAVHRAPLSRQAPTWVPAAEVRGEGIFLSLPEAVLRPWEDRVGAMGRPNRLLDAHVTWRERRNLDTGVGWQGHRYTLLHSLAHLLINELSLECGYSAASIRERIYCSEGGAEAMAGILLYTAAPDSEGTLGGLVSLAAPDRMATILGQALQRAQLCASDPLCAEHLPEPGDDSLHLAACHACLFIPETSCERGNRYLDRALVVPTLVGDEAAYFGSVA